MTSGREDTQSDVLVLGGGLVGASATFFLRRQHQRSVTLLERELIGRQASGTNFGNVRRQGRDLAQLPLANRARAVWGRAREMLNEDVEFFPYGHLRVCYTQAQAATFETYAADARQLGLDLELFDAAQLRRRWGIFGDDVVAGSLAPIDGHANPRLAGPAFARAARRDGARVLEHAEVLQVERDGSGFIAHAADGSRHRGEQLLICSGAWSNRFAEQFGERVPMEARAPQMGVTEPLPFVMGPSFGVSTPIAAEGLYFRQIRRGNVVFGGGCKGVAELDAVRAYVKPDNILRQFRELRRFAPMLAHAQLIRVWSGIEGYCEDGKPVIGASRAVPGVHYAFGLCGEGFAIGPGIGEVMAELIATGASSTPIAPFSIGRFGLASGKAL